MDGFFWACMGFVVGCFFFTEGCAKIKKYFDDKNKENFYKAVLTLSNDVEQL